MDTSTYLLAIGAGLLLSYGYLRHRRRAAAVRALATRLGFDYLGPALPQSFTLRGTGLEAATSFWNVINGERNGIRTVAFDCQIGTGKGSWRRTVIAAKATTEVFDALKFNIDLIVERSGDWLLLYQPKTASLVPPGLMPVAEIEAHLEAVAR